MTEIQKRLFALQDLGYRDFQCRLMPTVDSAAVIGVRKPDLRKLAQEFAREPAAEQFLGELPHRYYEENNLHGCLIASCGNYRQTVELLDQFLPYIDNWATCDMISPKVFKKHLPELLPEVRRWMNASAVYTIRFGIGMLMSFYLDEAFEAGYLEWVAALRSEQYYVNMMIAWFFATALAKQYEAALPYLEQQRLSAWTHNMTIRKATESYRITEEQKIYLKSLRIAHLTRPASTAANQ